MLGIFKPNQGDRRSVESVLAGFERARIPRERLRLPYLDGEIADDGSSYVKREFGDVRADPKGGLVCGHFYTQLMVREKDGGYRKKGKEKKHYFEVQLPQEPWIPKAA